MSILHRAKDVAIHRRRVNDEGRELEYIPDNFPYQNSSVEVETEIPHTGEDETSDKMVAAPKSIHGQGVPITQRANLSRVTVLGPFQRPESSGADISQGFKMGRPPNRTGQNRNELRQRPSDEGNLEYQARDIQTEYRKVGHDGHVSQSPGQEDGNEVAGFEQSSQDSGSPSTGVNAHLYDIVHDISPKEGITSDNVSSASKHGSQMQREALLTGVNEGHISVQTNAHPTPAVVGQHRHNSRSPSPDYTGFGQRTDASDSGQQRLSSPSPHPGIEQDSLAFDKGTPDELRQSASSLKVPHRESKENNSTKTAAEIQLSADTSLEGKDPNKDVETSKKIPSARIVGSDGKCAPGFEGDVFVMLPQLPQSKGSINADEASASSFISEIFSNAQAGSRKSLRHLQTTDCLEAVNTMKAHGPEENRSWSASLKTTVDPCPPATVAVSAVEQHGERLLTSPASHVQPLEPRQPGCNAQTVEKNHGLDMSSGRNEADSTVREVSTSTCRRPRRSDVEELSNLHRVVSKQGSIKIVKSKSKPRPRLSQGSEMAKARELAEDDERGITDVLKVLAWTLDERQQRKSKESEAATKALDGKIRNLLHDNQLQLQNLQYIRQEKQALIEILKERDNSIRARDLQIQKRDKVIDNVSGDINHYTVELKNIRQYCEELDKECKTHLANRKRLQEDAALCQERTQDIQLTMQRLREDAMTEIRQLTEYNAQMIKRLGDQGGLLAEERDRGVSLQHALTVSLNNNAELQNYNQGQQKIIGRLDVVCSTVTETRIDGVLVKERLEECLRVIQDVKSLEVVQPAHIEKLSELLQESAENVRTRLEELDSRGAEGLEGLKSVKESLTKQFESLKMELETTRTLQTENATLRESNAAFQERSAALQSSISTLRQELHDDRAKGVRLSEQVGRLEAENSAINVELLSKTAASLRMQELERLNGDLHAGLDKAQSELTGASEKLQAREATEINMVTELKELQSQLTASLDKIAMFDVQLNEKNQQMTENLNALRADLSKTALRMTEEATMDLENKLHQAIQSKNQSETKLKAARDELESTALTVRALTEQGRAREVIMSKIHDDLSASKRELEQVKESLRLAQEAERDCQAAMFIDISASKRELEQVKESLRLAQRAERDSQAAFAEQRSDSEAKAAQQLQQKNVEIQQLQHELSLLHAAKQETEGQVAIARRDAEAQLQSQRESMEHQVGTFKRRLSDAERISKETQITVEESRKQADSAHRNLQQTSKSELERSKQHIVVLEAETADLKGKLQKMESELHEHLSRLQGEPDRNNSSVRTNDEARLQTKTPPSTTNAQLKKRRKANRHNIQPIQVERTWLDNERSPVFGLQKETQVTTFSEAETELTNLRQLQRVDEDGTLQVALHETVPQTQYESLPTIFSQLNERLGKLGSSSSALSEVPSSPLRGQAILSVTNELQTLQPVAGNGDSSRLQSSLLNKSIPARPNTASKMSPVKRQRSVAAASCDVQSNQATRDSQSRERSEFTQPPQAMPSHESRPGKKTTSVHFSTAVGSSPSCVLQRGPTGSHSLVKYNAGTHSTSTTGFDESTHVEKQTLTSTQLPPSALKRRGDLMQHAQDNTPTPKRAKKSHQPSPQTYSPRVNEKSETAPQVQRSGLTTNKTKQPTSQESFSAQTSQSLSSRSLLRSSNQASNATKATTRGQSRKVSYSTRAAERFAQEFQGP